MSSMVKNQTHVGCFVANAVLGKSGKQFQREVERFLSQNGPEWTSSRLKAIWTAANHLRNGDKDSAVQLYQENSISYHKKDGTPKGPIRPAVVGYSHAQRPSKVKAFAAVLRMYTSLKVETLTEKQSAKAYNAITSRSEPSMPPEKMASLAVSMGPKVIRDLARGVSDGTVPEVFEPPIRSRYANSLRTTSYYYSREKLPKGMSPRKDPYASMTLSFMTEPWIPESLDELTPTQEMREVIRNDRDFPPQRFAGKITALQEQGVKARVVAMPTAYLQLAFMPLHARLNDIIRHSFPRESCMDNQRMGINGVIRALQDDKSVYSVDLSSATDRFPRDFSIQILRDLGMGNYADALREVSESEWDSPWGPVTYGAGQPMGLYSSFPLFHLSNALVAKACETQVRRNIRSDSSEQSLVTFQEGNSFFVLGDDIVFSDSRVADGYRDAMRKLDVPINQAKSFSGRVAEFAGFIAVPTTRGVIGFRPYKVPPGTFVSNPVNLLDAVGPSIARASKRWQSRFRDYQHTASERSIDLSPIFSEEDSVGNNPYRGDASTLRSLSLALSMQMDPSSLPDLSGDAKINRIPMFNERGVRDYYGFNPSELAASDVPSRGPHKETAKRLSQDPLMRKSRESHRKNLPVASGTQDKKVATSSRPSRDPIWDHVPPQLVERYKKFPELLETFRETHQLTRESDVDGTASSQEAQGFQP